MKIEHIGNGLEASLHIRGWGRFGGAGFLTFWLCGWAAGEYFALWFLFKGAWALLTAVPPDPGRARLAVLPGLGVGAFLLFWVSFWTLGGIMAWREWLRLMFGRDTILARYEGLEVIHSFGLFRSRQKVERGEIRRFYRQPSGRTLCVETSSGMIELTKLGTPQELEALEQALSSEFRLEPRPLEGLLPKPWIETASLENDAILVKDPAVRRAQTRTMWIIALPLATGALYTCGKALSQPTLWGLAIMFLVLGGLAVWGLVWLMFGRNEWRLERGRLVLQRRFGVNRSTLFEAASIRLDVDNSGDGGPSYDLHAVKVDAPLVLTRLEGRKNVRLLHRQSDDPTEPRRFGLWLSQRCQVPFEDTSAPEARAIEVEALLKQLAESGRVGKVVAGLLSRAKPVRAAVERARNPR